MCELRAYQLYQPLLRFIVLSVQPRIELVLVLLMVGLVLQPFEDLEVRLAISSSIWLLELRTSSSVGDAIEDVCWW